MNDNELRARRALGYSYQPHGSIEAELAARRAAGFSYQPPVPYVPVPYMKERCVPADRNTIIGWLQESALGGARWVVLATDNLTEGDEWYPIPTMSRDLVLRLAEDKDTREIYDLNLPFEEQLEEARAWHPPVDS